MSQIRGRECLSRIEDYVVETVPDADIIVNANETNESMGKKMEKKLVNAVLKEALNRYPSMHGEDLCAFLGKKYGLDPYLFCLGNGSSELLEKVCFAFGGKGRKIAYPAPSFSMYETYITLSDSTPVPYRLDEEFKVDADAVIKFCKKEKPDVLIVNNPNNPTGTYNARQMMEKSSAASMPLSSWMKPTLNFPMGERMLKKIRPSPLWLIPIISSSCVPCPRPMAWQACASALAPGAGPL